MGKNKNLTTNSDQNFILKGFNSIQIGLYILLGAYLIKSLLQNFIADENPIGMMSIEIIEVLSLSIVILVILFSTLAIFFSSRRQSRRSHHKVWNKKSKTHFWKFITLTIIGLLVLNYMHNSGYIKYLSPGFLLYFGLMLILLNSKKKKPYYLLAVISMILSVLVFLIPTYWYSSLLIVGVGFLVYGIMKK